MEQPGEWADGGDRRPRRVPGRGHRAVSVTAALGLAVALVAGSMLTVRPAAAQDEPEPPTPTTEPVPTTAPPTTAPPTTEAPTTLPPTTEAPPPTSPPTTAGGGGGPVRPTVPTTVATTEPPSTTTTAPRSTVVAPVPGAVTVPEEAPAALDEDPGGPWLSPDTQLRIAVGGLVALAVVMAALTAAYWRHTRPGRSTPLVGVGDAAVVSPDDGGDLAEGDAQQDDPGAIGAWDGPAEEGSEQSTGVPGIPVPPSDPTPAVAPGYSAAPPSALPPPSLGLRSVPGSGPAPGDVDR